jgi:hypothetical protein
MTSEQILWARAVFQSPGAKVPERVGYARKWLEKQEIFAAALPRR